MYAHNCRVCSVHILREVLSVLQIRTVRRVQLSKQYMYTVQCTTPLMLLQGGLIKLQVQVILPGVERIDENIFRLTELQFS